MSFPQVPGFEVRPIEVADADAWTRYAVLPEVKEHTSSAASSVEDVLAIIHRMLAGEPASPIHFALIPAGERRLVGTIGFHTISPLNGTAEVTYDVSPEYWGKGIATAACAAAVKWGFGVKGWNRIQATTLVAHERSQRVLLRCGFKHEGLLRSFRIVRGKPADYWLYSILPEEAARED